MPNWCDTTYKCVGDPKEVGELNAILEKLNNKFSKFWLSELIDGLGFDCEQYTCRGEITDFYYDDGTLTICQNTAWCEQEGVRLAIEKRFPSIKVYFLEEEPGCDVYYTNDETGSFFPERFLFESEKLHEYFVTIKDVCRFLKDTFGIEALQETADSVANAISRYSEDHDEWMAFHEISTCD